jgi:hypothetical protein
MGALAATIIDEVASVRSGCGALAHPATAAVTATANTTIAFSDTCLIEFSTSFRLRNMGSPSPALVALPRKRLVCTIHAPSITSDQSTLDVTKRSSFDAFDQIVEAPRSSSPSE